MTELSWGEVGELEKQGKYEKAAAAYAAIGFSRIVKSKFDVSTTYLVGLGIFLQGVSCDARAGNMRRAAGLQGLFEHMLIESVDEASSDVLRGLMHEWVGDSHLIIGSEDAFEWYADAEDHYHDLDMQTKLFWGLSQEFDHLSYGYDDFIQSQGETIEYDADEFLLRLDDKQAIAQRILADESSDA